MPAAKIIHLLQLAAAILLALWLTTQVRKPVGPVGQGFATLMNASHATLTDWGLKHVTIGKADRILDIGCGGGRTLAKLAARAPEGEIHGIDFSAASVATSRRTNAKNVASGRVRIERGSVEALPYPDRAFDVITAVETHYYWPNLAADMREVFRVLKPGGTFVLIAETHRSGPLAFFMALVMKLIRAAYLTDAEHRELLTQAGFTEVTTHHWPGGWICATGKRAT